MFACIHVLEKSEQLLDCAQAFSPQIEQTASDTVVLNAGGLEHIFGPAQEIAAAIARRTRELGIPANIALASNPDTAICAALGFGGISVVPCGDEAKFLERLPLSILSPCEELLETLERWGVRTFRDLAALPMIGVAERLGPEGLRLQRLARGEVERPLVPVESPLCFEEELELDYPVELLEPLLFVLSRLLHEICARLETRGLATNELRLRLKLEDRSGHERFLRLPVPMRDTRTFLKLLQLDLDSHPPAMPVVGVWIAAEPVQPRVAQNGLFVPVSPEPEKLEITLARIAGLVGEGNVGSPELVDTHRPGAFRMRRFSVRSGSANQEMCRCMALRAFRPVRCAQVQTMSGRPSSIAAAGIRGKVVSSAGPWRTSGDWWTANPWARDEWDIALSDGALYRIYCEHQSGRWFVEGSYD